MRARVLVTLSALSGLALAGCDPRPKPVEEHQTTAGAPPPIADVRKSLGADELKLPALPPLPGLATSVHSTAQVEVGRRLFFDPRLSGDGKIACYSCHQNENGTGGATPLSVGAFAKKLPRHSPVLWNIGYLPTLYWDGRAQSLEDQAKAAWAGGNLGVGKDKIEAKAQYVAQLPEYKPLFLAAFPGEKVSSDTIARALAAYERTLICSDTAYDKYVAGDKSALSTDEKSGLALFMGKAMCMACHAPPHFSTAYMGEGAFFNVGVGTKDVADKDVDVGRMKVTDKEQDWAAFKPPTLRNVAKTAPYFHDGSGPTLRGAVKFMASGGQDNRNKTPLMTDRHLTDPELDQLVAFLGALTCGGQLVPPAH